MESGMLWVESPITLLYIRLGWHFVLVISLLKLKMGFDWAKENDIALL